MLNDDGTLATSVLATVPPPALTTDGTATSAALTAFRSTATGWFGRHRQTPRSGDVPSATTSVRRDRGVGDGAGQGSLMIQAFKVDPRRPTPPSRSPVRRRRSATPRTCTARRRPASRRARRPSRSNWGLMTTTLWRSVRHDLHHPRPHRPLHAEREPAGARLPEPRDAAERAHRGGIDTGSVVDFSMLTTMGGQAFPASTTRAPGSWAWNRQLRIPPPGT